MPPGNTVDYTLLPGKWPPSLPSFFFPIFFSLPYSVFHSKPQSHCCPALVFKSLPAPKMTDR